MTLFATRTCSSGMSAGDRVAAIHDQGGLAVAAHPYSLAQGLGDLAGRLPFDAIEMINGSPLMELSNVRAGRRLARARAARVGGSDAHVAPAAGGVHTLFPGTGAAELRAAVLARLTRPAVDLATHVAAMPQHLAWLTWVMLR